MSKTPSPKVSRDYEMWNAKNLQMLNMHFQSLCKMGKLLEAIIEDSNRDITISTETWLDSTICSAVLILFELGYDIQRSDRPNDPHRVVLIAVKNTFKLEKSEQALNS